MKFSKKASAAAKYLCFDIAEPLLNAIFDCNFANLKENRHPSLGFRVIFRVLFLCVLAVLSGCSQNDTSKSVKKFADDKVVNEPVCLMTYTVLDSVLIEKFFDTRLASFSKDIQKVLDDITKLSKKKTSVKDSLQTESQDLVYRVCFSDVDGVETRHPCSLDSALLVNVVKKMNGEDSLKGLRIKLQSISYAQSVVDGVPTMSKMILNEDGSLEAACASKDGKKCDDLYAQVILSKKFSMGKFLEEDGSTWVPERYYVRINENKFPKDLEIDSLLASIFERSLKHFYRENEVDSLIPFEMCYENGFAVPCGLSPQERAFVKETAENYGDTLIAVTYQKSLTMKAFVYDGMSSSHFCKSQNGVRCSELYALVREKNEKLERFCKMLEERNVKHVRAGAMYLCDAVDSRMALFRFSMKDFYAAKEELSHGDVMLLDWEGTLYKKDGTYLGREKNQ